MVDPQYNLASDQINGLDDEEDVRGAHVRQPEVRAKQSALFSQLRQLAEASSKSDVSNDAAYRRMQRNTCPMSDAVIAFRLPAAAWNPKGRSFDEGRMPSFRYDPGL